MFLQPKIKTQNQLERKQQHTTVNILIILWTFGIEISFYMLF